MTQKVLIIGANGALGSDLMKNLAHSVAATHDDFDITDASATREFILKSGVKKIVNTAAFHNVPKCEDAYQVAFEVNVIGVRNLARICAEYDIHLCQVSTDYVFDGCKRTPYLETDRPAPLSLYGITKLAGEHMLAASAKNWCVVRSSGLYGEVPTRAKGGNFINTMLRLGREQTQVTVVNDEYVAPTYTHDLALSIGALLDADGKGIFHITNSGMTTWYDFATVIFQFYKLPAKLLPVPASQFQSVVKRPAYSLLDCSKFETLSKQKMPDWKDALLRHLRKLVI